MDILRQHEVFEIVVLLRKGIALPEMDSAQRTKIQRKIDRLKDMDFKVKLGSILEMDARQYYISNKFAFLKEKLAEV